MSASQAQNLDSLFYKFEHATDNQTKKEYGLLIVSFKNQRDAKKVFNFRNKLLTLNMNNVDSLNIEFLGNIASLYAMNYHFDSAIFFIRKAIRLGKSFGSEMVLAREYDQAGYIYYRKGKMDSAYFYNLKAGRIFEVYDDQLAYATNLFRKGVFAKEMGKYEEATKAYLKAIQLYEKLGNKKYVRWLYGNIGNLFLKLDSPDKAKNYFEIALSLSIDAKDSTNIAGNFNNLGTIYMKQEKDSIALIYYQKAEKLNREIKNYRWLSYNLTNIGVIYTREKNFSKAIEYTLKAIDLKLKLGDKKQLATSYSNLADIYHDQKNYLQATVYYDKAIAHIKETGIMKNSEWIYNNAAKTNYKIRKFRQAYDYLRNAYLQKDSIFAKEKIKAISEVETKYQIAKKEQQIKELELSQRLQRSKEKMYIGGLLAASVIILLSSIFFYVKRKKDKELSMQKDRLYKKEKALADLEIEKIRLKERELESKISYKSKQLTTHALNMMQKNKLLQELKKDLKDLAKMIPADSKQTLRNISRSLDRNLKLDSEWDLFKRYFEDVNRDFYQKLSKLNPEITSTDMRIAALIKLNLNIKESASVLNIEPNSIKTARYRLRKKLSLQPGDSLSDFIGNL
jgi:tetratricopeptide (TPR) repeat protein